MFLFGLGMIGAAIGGAIGGRVAGYYGNKEAAMQALPQGLKSMLKNIKDAEERGSMIGFHNADGEVEVVSVPAWVINLIGMITMNENLYHFDEECGGLVWNDQSGVSREDVKDLATWFANVFTRYDESAQVAHLKVYSALELSANEGNGLPLILRKAILLEMAERSGLAGLV